MGIISIMWSIFTRMSAVPVFVPSLTENLMPWSDKIPENMKIKERK